MLFRSPGDLPAQHEGRPGTPRVIVHAFPLAFASWAAAYDEGVALRSVDVAQVPGDCWPLALKCRSRMHYHLADSAARAAEPGARALVCHVDGRVSETSTANVAIVRGDTAYNKNIAQATIDAAKASNGAWQIGDVIDITAGTKDWSPVIAKLKASKPGVKIGRAHV